MPLSVALSFTVLVGFRLLDADSSFLANSALSINGGVRRGTSGLYSLKGGAFYYACRTRASAIYATSRKGGIFRRKDDMRFCGPLTLAREFIYV